MPCEPPPTPTRRPGAQPGNRNARKHGIYSGSPPDPQATRAELRQRTRTALRAHDGTERSAELHAPVTVRRGRWRGIVQGKTAPATPSPGVA